MEVRRYRYSRNKRKEFKRGMGGGMSHIGLVGHLEKEDEMREEGPKKKQKTKEKG